MSSLRNLTARALHKIARTVEPQRKIVYLTDEYITWLRFANSGMLEPGSLYLMDYAIGHLPSAAPILEIGSFCGLSANVITRLKQKHGVTNPLITCDKWEFENVNGRNSIADSPVLFSDYRTFVRDSYIRNVGMFSGHDLPFTVEMTSDEFFADWKAGSTCIDVLGRSRTLGGTFSFCYIDGNHTYEYVKRDFLNSDEFLETGGFLLFDDSTLLEFDVHRLMPEIIASGGYELVAANPYHLFRKTAPLKEWRRGWDSNPR